jgi:hypothetical protein
MRYMYLAGLKGLVHPCRQEGNPSSHLKGGHPKIPASGCGYLIPVKNGGDIRMAQGHLETK